MFKKMICLTLLMVSLSISPAKSQENHPNDVKSCNNVPSNPNPCKCDAAMMCKGSKEDSKCQVYCEPDKCDCSNECWT